MGIARGISAAEVFAGILLNELEFIDTTARLLKQNYLKADSGISCLNCFGNALEIIVIRELSATLAQIELVLEGSKFDPLSLRRS